MATKKASTPKKQDKAPAAEGVPSATLPTPQAQPVHDNLPLLDDLRLVFSIELGRTRKSLEEVSDLGEQSLVELDKWVGDPVDVLLNGRLFARGEVVTVAENFGVRITQIVGSA